MKYIVELPEVWALEILEHDEKCDGYWISSLTQSWQKGYPDNCTLPWTNYVDLVRRLRHHTKKKIVVDVDMLYNEPSVGALICKELFSAGCDEVVIESKRFPKVNSLTPEKMVLSTPEEFSRMINKVKTSVPNLKVHARLEYLAMTKDVQQTVSIAKRVMSAGADGVVVHWGADSNTSILKDALAAIKHEKIPAGIIPTKFLEQVTAGHFEELADFSILGNICSSFIRHSFASKSIDDLLKIPCEFKPLLNRASSHEPLGQSTLIILGAMPQKNGSFALEDPAQCAKFVDLAKNYFSVLLVTSPECKLDPENLSGINRINIESSLGEVHSLSSAMDSVNTENISVVYADIEDEIFRHCGTKDGMIFSNDAFAGFISTKSDLLSSLVAESSPDESMLQMTSRTNINSIIIS
ncbi:isocitrate lyase/phosphoenolpyruvate mutase family protein [Pseudomonadota bacterium]|nr:isocitrate lyase/phosphoenolpyruvate mutase family protein [Pseudomonadota bacterium]